MKRRLRPFEKALNAAVFQFPGTRRLGERYTGGLNAETACRQAGKLNKQGIHASFNYLGEHRTDTDEINQTIDEYKKVIGEIHDRGLNASVSVKPTMLGLDLSEEQALGFISEIVHHAQKHGVFVWIDMEGSKYTTQTLNIYKKIAAQTDKVGVVVQANLKRTARDLTELSRELGKQRVKLRLCKGAYIEPEEIAHQTSEDIDGNYGQIIENAFQHSSHVAVASHDEPFLHLAEKISKDHPDVHLEFQMLRGIHPQLERKFAEAGHHVTQYIPYGPEALGTLVRRLLKGRNAASLVAKSFFGHYAPKDRK